MKSRKVYLSYYKLVISRTTLKKKILFVFQVNLTFTRIFIRFTIQDVHYAGDISGDEE